MHLSPRDYAIAELISQFGYMTSKQLQELAFTDVRSNNPSYRSFNRLVNAGFLERLGYGVQAGGRGGRSQDIFKLGRLGRQAFSHRTTPSISQLNHTLKVADCYLCLVRLQRAGKLTIAEYATEPSCHVTISRGMDRYVLRPDMFAALSLPRRGTLRAMFEIDMSSQSDNQILSKMRGYWGAQTSGDWPDGQVVVFIAKDDRRVGELTRLLGRGEPGLRELFRVWTLERMVEVLANA